jgi:hypothetical protein
MTVDDACSCFSDGGLESCCVLASDSVFSLSLFSETVETRLPSHSYTVFSLSFLKAPFGGRGIITLASVQNGFKKVLQRPLLKKHLSNLY